jgi:hypothetical protein
MKLEDKMSQSNQLAAVTTRTEYFSKCWKQQLIPHCDLYLTRLETKLALDHYTKFVLHKMDYNFCLRSNLIAGTEVKLWLWSKYQLNKVKTRVLGQWGQFLHICSTWTLNEFCCRVHLKSFGHIGKVWLMVYSSINLMGQFPIGAELIISCDFLIPNFMELFQGLI